jgi:hypothetical protein
MQTGHDTTVGPPDRTEQTWEYWWDVDWTYPLVEVTRIRVRIAIDSDYPTDDEDGGPYVQSTLYGWKLKDDGTRDKRQQRIESVYFLDWGVAAAAYEKEARRLSGQTFSD